MKGALAVREELGSEYRQVYLDYLSAQVSYDDLCNKRGELLNSDIPQGQLEAWEMKALKDRNEDYS